VQDGRGSAVCASAKIARRASASLFTERLYDLIVDWPDEIRNHSPGGGLNESLNRHSRHELETSETDDLAIRNGDSDGVVSGAALLILADVCRDPAECSVEFGRGALAKCGKAHHSRLTELQLVDILWLHLRLNRQRFVFGHDEHDRIALGSDDTPDRVDGKLMHDAVLRSANVDPL
jgi:hypothetical protein